jgi:3,5-dihydroxyphenylacetyl-CoA synthase
MMTRSDEGHPRILSVGSSHPAQGWSQAALLERFEVTDAKIRSIFLNSHINNRYLYLPELGPEGELPEETSLELWNKHRAGAMELGSEAIARALTPLGLSVRDIDYLSCVSSTGFLCPSLTARFIEKLGFRNDIHRFDVVGMGCNAALNALQPIANYCGAQRSGVGLELCVEVCSAAYVFDRTMRTSVVNCLFGDGAAAVVVGVDSDKRRGPHIIGFSSHIIPQAINAMRFDFDGEKNSFFLDKNIPYVIGEQVHVPVDALLQRFGLKRRDISHWVVHSGGKKVLDSIKYSLGLSDHDLRHTQSVLRDFGNLSSGSVLFSLERLVLERSAVPGEYVVLMAMGPGSSIECCLGRF